jgi:hypothetical protein
VLNVCLTNIRVFRDCSGEGLHISYFIWRASLCGQVGIITEQTWHRWKKSYGGILPSVARATGVSAGSVGIVRHGGGLTWLARSLNSPENGKKTGESLVAFFGRSGGTKDSRLEFGKPQSFRVVSFGYVRHANPL